MRSNSESNNLEGLLFLSFALTSSWAKLYSLRMKARIIFDQWQPIAIYAWPLILLIYDSDYTASQCRENNRHSIPLIIISDLMPIDPEVNNTGRVTFITNVGRVALTSRTEWMIECDVKCSNLKVVGSIPTRVGTFLCPSVFLFPLWAQFHQ